MGIPGRVEYVGAKRRQVGCEVQEIQLGPAQRGVDQEEQRAKDPERRNPQVDQALLAAIEVSRGLRRQRLLHVSVPSVVAATVAAIPQVLAVSTGRRRYSDARAQCPIESCAGFER